MQFFATLVLLFAFNSTVKSDGTLLVLNKSDNTASLIDRATGKEIATIPTGVGPHEVAVSPNGKLAVVANYGNQGQPGSTLTVMDIPAKRQVKTINLGEYRRPHGIVWLKGSQVAVTTEANKTLLIVDVETEKVLSAIDTDQNVSHMVVVSKDGSRAFVSNIGSGSVTVIDLKDRKRIANISTGGGAEGVDISPNGKEVWIGNRAANTLTVMDATTLEVKATLESKDFPIRVKFTPDGKHVLVSNARSGDVAVFDAEGKKEIRRIPMMAKAAEDKAGGGQRIFGDQFGSSPVPVGILISPDGRHAYIANTNADIVTVIDLKTWQITNRLTAGKEPDGLGFSQITVK